MADPTSLQSIIARVIPSEIYNFAGQSHVTYSFQLPSYTFQVNLMGVLNLLTAVVHCGLESRVRLYQVGRRKADRSSSCFHKFQIHENQL